MDAGMGQTRAYLGAVRRDSSHLSMANLPRSHTTGPFGSWLTATALA